ncbi:hypothetical protein F4818DRAFT_246836 [Hypoxylon cercidicola]|nr:hypothetical protein F4818DRAFT_246836 [Hypoxylon cercidicola]
MDYTPGWYYQLIRTMDYTVSNRHFCLLFPHAFVSSAMAYGYPAYLDSGTRGIALLSCHIPDGVGTYRNSFTCGDVEIVKIGAVGCTRVVCVFTCGVCWYPWMPGEVAGDVGCGLIDGSLALWITALFWFPFVFPFPRCVYSRVVSAGCAICVGWALVGLTLGLKTKHGHG